MDANVKASNKVKIETIIKNLEKRNMTGFYAEDSAEAAEIVKGMIPEGASVASGGSMTLAETGIKDWLKENCDYNDPFAALTAQASMAKRKAALTADVFLASANAITLDGEIVNIDGSGNRVAAMIFGPDKVILVVGANKIVENVHDAYDRVRSDACPPNAIRLNRETPCALTGKCVDCKTPGQTICSHLVTTRFSSISDRIFVVLVNENLGY